MYGVLLSRGVTADYRGRPAITRETAALGGAVVVKFELSEIPWVAAAELSKHARHNGSHFAPILIRFPSSRRTMSRPVGGDDRTVSFLKAVAIRAFESEIDQAPV